MAAQSDLDDAAPASSVGEGGGGGGGGDESSGRRLIVDTVRGLLACASRDEPSTNSLPVAHRIHCTAAHQQMALGALTILLGAAISYAAYKLIGPMIKKSDDEDDIPGTSPSTSSNINDSNNNSSGGINAARHVSSYTKGQLAGGGFNSDTIAQLDHDRAAFLKGEDSNSGGTHARTPARCPFTGDKLSDDDDDDEDEGENGGGCCPIVADIEEDVEELNKALKDKEITGKPIADSATPARSQQLFDDNDAGSGPCTTDVLDRLGDLHGKLATAKLRMQQREFEKQMSDKEREEESAVRARQMEAIFALMQQHQDKFGIQNEAEFAEQMRMYST